MIESGKTSSEALLLRGALRQRLGAIQDARSDFDKALSISSSDAGAQRGIRLVAADAALANGDALRAMRILEPLQKDGFPDAVKRYALAALLQQPGRSRAYTAWTFDYPVVSCNADKSFSMVCTVVPGAAPADPGFLAADEAYRAFGASDFALAITKAAEAVNLSPRNKDYRRLHVQALAAQMLFGEAEQAANAALMEFGRDGALLLARAEARQRQGNQAAANIDYAAVLAAQDNAPRIEVAALVGLGRNAAARERLAEITRTAPVEASLDLAYLALQIGDNRSALDLFGRADTSGKLSDAARYDAAYTASRLGHNEQAIRYFKQTIDAAASGRFALEPQQVYDARRAVADLSRRWGAYASLSRRGVAAAGVGVPQGGPIDGVEAGAEVYWRPYGFQNGKLLEIYGRLNETVAGDRGVQTGSATAQAAIGARVKPFSETNVVFALERLVGLGSLTRDNWLVRAGFSSDTGVDFKVGQSNWFTSHFYAEAGHYFRHSQSYFTLEGQVGRTYRLGSSSSTIAIFPHLVIGADYDSALVNREKHAWGSGIGTNLRYWYRQDPYNAPRSYADVSLQYRWKIAGDRRAEGLFARITAAY
jgi:adsorption protein A